jgi:hypothetical protein|tara:strand:- start:3509 stop:4306 length:798 start_codon:yes stop_codon:yes gene_type:complete
MKNVVGIVFDMDETLGEFIEAGMFWDGMKEFLKTGLTDEHFFKMLDLYPEFLRPGIYTILNYLKKLKLKHKNLKVYLFTNNQGPPSWPQLIVKYFEWKLSYSLFTKIVGPYKIGNQVFEKCRTSHDKQYEEFLQCTDLPDSTQLCFVDDQEHYGMDHENVFYIKIKPYHYSLQSNIMIERFVSSYLASELNIDANRFVNFMQQFLSEFSYRHQKKQIKDYIHDRNITNRLFAGIKTFLKNKLHKVTQKNKTINRNKTHKKSKNVH